MRISVVIIFLFSISYLNSQNYFPVKISNEYQEELIHNHSVEYLTGGFTSYTLYSYPEFDVNDSVYYQNLIYYKFRDLYYAYDSLQQKLFIYLDSSYTAVDFNAPSGSQTVLYLTGTPRTWYSLGVTDEIIYNQTRKVFKMHADTTFYPGPSRHTYKWKVGFASGIGWYYNEYDSDIMTSFEITRDNFKNTFLLAKIDTIVINNINKNITLRDSIRDRNPDEFPYILKTAVENLIGPLVTEFCTEYYIYRADTLIASKVFEIDKSSLNAFINIQPEEVAVNDIIKFRCVLKDSSIFNNTEVAPDTGFFLFKIVSPVSLDDGEISPDYFNLYQNFPNPFNSRTRIAYSIPYTSRVKLQLFDMLGNLITSLLDEEKDQGYHYLDLDFDLSGERKLSSGVYYYRLTAGEYSSVKKLVFLK